MPYTLSKLKKYCNKFKKEDTCEEGDNSDICSWDYEKCAYNRDYAVNEDNLTKVLKEKISKANRTVTFRYQNMVGKKSKKRQRRSSKKRKRNKRSRK